MYTEKNGMMRLEHSDSQAYGHNPSLSASIPASFPQHWRCRKAAWSSAMFLNYIKMTEFTPSHTTPDLVGDRPCFPHSLSGNLISLQYIVLDVNSITTEREKN